MRQKSMNIVQGFFQKPMQGVKAEEKGRKCPDCGSEDLEYDEHEQLVCRKCGFVVEE